MRIESSLAKRLTRFLFPLLVAILAGWIATAMLFGPSWEQKGLRSHEFSASVMLALGKGFCNQSESSAPALANFFAGRANAITPSDLPADFQGETPEAFQLDHRYLMYLVGAAWRCFGISWDVYRYVLVGTYVITGLVIYGLFRLAMNRVFSLASALFVLGSPLFTERLYDMRDFIKAPFILAVLAVLVLLIKRPVKTIWYFLSFLLLGMLIGVGIGFRLDIFICIVPAILVALFCERPARHHVSERLAAICLLMAAFLVPAYPIFSGSSNGGTEQWHHMMMGLSNEANRELGLGGASYDWMYAQHDGFVGDVAENFGHRLRPHEQTTRNFQLEKRMFLTEFIKIFPADMLIRGYVSVLRILTTLPFQSGWMGLAAAVGALAVIAAQSQRRALLIAIIIIYFCGYVSLQFHLRHLFHLACVPVCLAGFLLDRAVYAGYVGGRALFRGSLGPAFAAAWPASRRVLAVAGITAFLFLAPLGALIPWQRHKIDQLAATCLAAPLAPVETSRTLLDNGLVQFYPVKASPLDHDIPRNEYPVVAADYFVAEFATSPRPAPFAIKYDGVGIGGDFSGIVRLSPTGPDDADTFKYFFPVYEDMWTHFSGIIVPSDQAAAFKGLHKVTDLAPFRLLIDLAVPQKMEHFHYFKKPDVWPVDDTYRRLEDAINPNSVSEACEAMKSGNAGKALDIYRALLAKQPENLAYLAGTGAALEAAGSIGDALDLYRRGVEIDPASPICYEAMDRFWEKQRDTASPVAEWSATAAKNPLCFRPFYHLGMAQMRLGKPEEAIAAFEQAMHLMPNQSQIKLRLAKAHAAKNEFDKAIPLYESACNDAPPLEMELCDYSNALNADGQKEKAVKILEDALATDPGSSCLSFQLNGLLAATQPAEAREAFWRAFAGQYPMNKQALTFLGLALLDRKDYDGAIDACKKCLEANPDDPDATQCLVTTLGQKGDIEAAVTMAMLHLDKHKRPEDLSRITEHIAGNADNAFWAGDFDRVRQAFRVLFVLDPLNPRWRERMARYLSDCGAVNDAVAEFAAARALAPLVDAAIALAAELAPASGNTTEIEVARFSQNRGLPDAGDTLPAGDSQFTTALQDLKQAYRVENFRFLSCISVIGRLIDARKPAEALAVANAILEKHPSAANWMIVEYAAAALRSERAGALDDENEILRTALSLFPASTALKCAAAGNCEARDGKSSAVAAYHAVIDEDPAFIPAYTALDALLSNSDNKEAELSTWRAIIEKHGDIPEPLLFLANALERRLDYDAGLDVCDKGMKTFSWNDDFTLEKGRLLALKDDVGALKPFCKEVRARGTLLIEKLGRELARVAEELEAQDKIGPAIKIADMARNAALNDPFARQVRELLEAELEAIPRMAANARFNEFLVLLPE